MQHAPQRRTQLGFFVGSGLKEGIKG